MKNKTLLLLFSLLLSLTSFAQKEKMSREDKDEKNAARMARINSKNDYGLFRKQIQALREFEAERQKIPALRKSSKMPVKVVAFIDSNDNDAEGTTKTLIGYIRQDVGDNSTNMYEIIYDRAQRTIVSVRHTPEAIEADREFMEEQQEKASPEKRQPKKVIQKKAPAEDDDDEDGKPVKGKKKAKDDDD